MARDIQVTKEGYEKMKKELAELQGPTRMAIAEAIREAKSHGDLRENAAYHEAKLNQTRLEMRISELEKAVLYAKIVERPEVQGDTAQLGSSITLLDLEFQDELLVTLVGAFESDPASGNVSISSPMGTALVDQIVGAQIAFDSPGGRVEYKILKIE